MAFNPNYDEIGKTFVSQYYSIFDNPDTRAQLVVFYNVRSGTFSWKWFTTWFISLHGFLSLQPTTSFMTFEGCQVQGAEKIIEKFQVRVLWNVFSLQ